MASTTTAPRQAFRLALTILISAFLFLAQFAYIRSITPLYGTVPTELHVAHVASAAFITAAIVPGPVLFALTFVGPLISLAPFTAFWVASLTARSPWTPPPFGPAITHLAVLFPILYLGATIQMKVPRTVGAFQSFVIVQSVLWSTAIGFFPWSTWLMDVSDDTIMSNIGQFITSIGVVASVSTSWWASPPPSRVKSSKAGEKANAEVDKPLLRTTNVLRTMIPIFLPMLIRRLESPTIPKPLLEPYTHPTYPVRILSSTNSVSGRVVVGEVMPEDGGALLPLRYLRASHSLLGGVWLGDNAVTIDGSPAPNDSFGTPIGDSIYSAFNYQEAARLVNSTNISKYQSSLIIGLGTGISATALAKHGISNTIIEIDPAVYSAARQYFGLPDPGPENIFTEDARAWVTRKQSSLSDTNTRPISVSDTYDIIIHDCFSGGGVPQHIYTTEFWRDIKAIMNPQGVLAVNIAGHILSDSSRAVLFTLEKTFPQCRAFHDHDGELTLEVMQKDFINMILFCTISRKPITFRPSVSADYLNSYLRRQVLSNLPNSEVDLSLIRGNLTKTEMDELVLTDLNNPLGRWQDVAAIEHWHVMRKVLPHSHWQTY